MAKKTNNTTPGATDHNAPTELEYGAFKVALSDIAPAGISYLLSYGFGKSLQDSVSGIKKEVLAAFADQGDNESGDDFAKRMKVRDAFRTESGLGEYDEPAEIAEAVLSARMSKRLAAIIAGTVGHTAKGPRVTGVDKIAREVAEEMIRAAATKQKKPMPKGDNLRDLIDSLLAKDEARGFQIKQEAERRFAMESIEIDL